MLIKSVMKICPICFRYTHHDVDIDRYYQYLRVGGNIDKAFPDYKENKRIFLSKGICYKCQEKMNDETRKAV